VSLEAGQPKVDLVSQVSGLLQGLSAAFRQVSVRPWDALVPRGDWQKGHSV
jgi:hypothetical protein